MGQIGHWVIKRWNGLSLFKVFQQSILSETILIKKIQLSAKVVKKIFVIIHKKDFGEWSNISTFTRPSSLFSQISVLSFNIINVLHLN